MQHTILLCDAETNLTTVLAEYLEDKGYRVLRVNEIRNVVDTLRTQSVDAVLMDISNPGGNGFTLIRQIRAAEFTMPILVLSERSDRTDILRAYELGTDDYILKPYSMEILVAKLRVWIARTSEPEENKEVVFDLRGVRFDGRRGTLGTEALGPKKSMLLLMLCRRMNQVVDRHRMLRDVWGHDDEFCSRSLSVYMTDIRKRVTALGYQIQTIPGKGYSLIEEV